MRRLRDLAAKIADFLAVSLYLIYLVAEAIAERLAQVRSRGSALWQGPKHGPDD